jgi:hypothetical protein
MLCVQKQRVDEKRDNVSYLSEIKKLGVFKRVNVGVKHERFNLFLDIHLLSFETIFQD